ncbi:MAG: glycosyltransferase family 39 protein [Candidatus Omnitrophota bacterium]
MSKKRWVVLILSGILLFHFVNNFIWLQKDNLIYGPDSAWHLIEAIKFHFTFKNILHSQASFFAQIGQWIQTFRYWPTTNWPPLVYFLSALINPQEIHLFSLRMYVNFIFYVLLVLSTYFLGKKCFNRRAGLIAAFLIGFYPAVCAFSRQFQLDFPLLCVTAACVCLLVYSENFSKRGYSLLFGLSLGMGTLVKLQIMVFLLVPLLYATFGIFRPQNSEKLNRSSNFILSTIIAFSLFYLYWGNRIGTMLTSFHDHLLIYYPFYTNKTALVSVAPIPIFSLRNFTFYLEGLIAHVYLLPFILFICALVVLLISKNKWRFFYLFSFLIPYLIFSFISVKWTRYALPLLVFMAVISGWVINSIRLRYIKVAILCVLVFYSMRLYLTGSWTSHDGHSATPFCFFKSTLPDILFPGLIPPVAFDYTEELKKEGIIPHIEQGLRDGKAIRIAFSGDNVEDTIVLLYFYFQDAIFKKRIAIYERHVLDFQNADYIVMKDSDLLTEKELLRNYRVLSRIQGRVFLIKK